jgi:hypothetical protein
MFAENITTRTQCPIGDQAHDFLTYRNLDGGCFIPDSNGNFIPLQLLNFSLFVNGSTTQDSTFESTISVNPTLVNGILNLGISGFPITGDGITTSYALNYTIDPPPVLDSMGADFDPPSGNITGSVHICGDPNANGGCATSDDFGFGVTNGVPFAGSSRFHNVDGTPILVSALVTHTIFTLSPDSGFDSLNYTVTTTEATPEPGAWVLAASALSFLAFRRKLRRG